MTLTREQIMPIVKVARHFQVTIPAEVRGKLRIRKGDLLEATIHGDAVMFTPKVFVDRKSVELTEDIEQVSAGKTVAEEGNVKQEK